MPDLQDLLAPQPQCPDCDVMIGEPHVDGCDVARCLVTGLQRLSCEADHDCGTDTWTGRWPGETDCERLGWMIMPNRSDLPGLPDLNRLYTQATWNPATRQWDART